MFRNAQVDFTCPDHIEESLLENEYLEDYPQIRFKRVCIIIGSNAAGKTTLGRLMCLVNNYLSGVPVKRIAESIYDRSRPAVVDVLYVVPALEKLRRLRVEMDVAGLRRETLWETPLCKSKELKALEEDMEAKGPVFDWMRSDKKSGVEMLPVFSRAHLSGWQLDKNAGWRYIFNEMDISSQNPVTNLLDLYLLGQVLRTLDPSIYSVEPSRDKSNACVIVFTNGDRVIVENDQVHQVDRLRLSRGVLEAIKVASLMASIARCADDAPQRSNTFFLDEKMAHFHTDMEKSVLSMMIKRLGRYSQLFYTTRNHDMLNMALPNHNYLFMRKNDFVEFVQPEKMSIVTI